MFVCLVLIGLTSDVVCVCAYYGGYIVSPPPLRHRPSPNKLSTSSSHCPTHLFFYQERSHTRQGTHAHAKQSYPMLFCTVTERLEKSIHTPRLSVSPFSESGGVISDRGLVINSIKRVWLPWQIGLGYNIIISASSAVIMGHSSQMRVRLIGREDGDGKLREKLFFFRQMGKSKSFCLENSGSGTLWKREKGAVKLYKYSVVLQI